MTLYLLGATTVLALRPDKWSWPRFLDRLNRLASIGARPKGVGAPIEAERHLRAAALRESWGQHTTEFHALIGATWAPSTDDIWSTP